MKLVVGLGNVGAHFTGTRHNVGFAVLDNFAASHNLEWTLKEKFKAIIAEGSIHDQKVILAKPTTFYNLSGESVRAIKDFYKIENTDILIVHDELALPFGTVRTRLGGSDAGNNGIKSVINHCGVDFIRVRTGIANDVLANYDAADFVLGRFSATETADWPKVVKEACHQLDLFIHPDKTLALTSVRITT
jgi:PTH1 family peptidyl-tRNA hydrolase